MRKIKFRAKVTRNLEPRYLGDGKVVYNCPAGIFIYGNLVSDYDDKPYIDIQGYDHSGSFHLKCKDIDTNTIGQFTGLHDCNGKGIYEGDVITIQKISVKFIVTWNDELGGFFLSDGCRPLGTWLQEENMEVIGNIHDNPELIKEVKL